MSPYGEFGDPTPFVHQNLEESLSSDASAIRQRCEKQCSSHKFHDARLFNYFRTFNPGLFDDPLDRTENGTMGLWFRNSDYLYQYTRIFPSLRLLDLVLYIGSIYSVWFGLSALNTIDSLFSLASSLKRFTLNIERKKRFATQERSNTHGHSLASVVK